MSDVLIAVVDGLRGFPEAIEAVFPHTPDTNLHRAPDPHLAQLRGLEGSQGAGCRTEGHLPGPQCRRGGSGTHRVRARCLGQEMPAHCAGLAATVDTGDPVLRLSNGAAQDHLHHQRHRESAHATAQDRENRGHFPSDEAATKLLFLALRNIVKDWKMPPRTWKEAANQFAILFGERFTAALN